MLYGSCPGSCRLGTALPAVFRNAPFAVARGFFSIPLAKIRALEALYAPGPKHAWVMSKIHLVLLATSAGPKLFTVWGRVHWRFLPLILWMKEAAKGPSRLPKL